MNSIKLICLLMLAGSNTQALQTVTIREKQNADCTTAHDSLTKQTVYTKVDQMPEYVGGTAEFLEYFASNYTVSIEDFQASFKFEFIVEADSSINGARIKNKNTQQLTVAEKEALRVITEMPKWVPGKCKGQNVPVLMVIPIFF